MVFDIPRAVDVFELRRAALELGEDRGERLADKIGQHVQSAPVGHADHKLTDAQLAAATQDCLERWHQRLGALDAEPLGAGVATIEKPLECLGGGQDLQDLLFNRCRQLRALLFLVFFLNPRPLGRHLDVHVFDADRAAVGRSQQRDDLAQGGALATEQVVDEDLTVEIGLGKTVAVVVELGVGPAFFEAGGSRSASRWPRTRYARIRFKAQIESIAALRSPSSPNSAAGAAPSAAVTSVGFDQAGPRRSVSTVERSSPISEKNRRQLSSTELGSLRKRA